MRRTPVSIGDLETQIPVIAGAIGDSGAMMADVVRSSEANLMQEFRYHATETRQIQQQGMQSICRLLDMNSTHLLRMDDNFNSMRAVFAAGMNFMAENMLRISDGMGLQDLTFRPVQDLFPDRPVPSASASNTRSAPSATANSNGISAPSADVNIDTSIAPVNIATIPTAPASPVRPAHSVPTTAPSFNIPTQVDPLAQRLAYRSILQDLANLATPQSETPANTRTTYKYTRGLKTVRQLWNEWTVGGRNTPPFRTLHRAYQADSIENKWFVDDNERRVYGRRAKVNEYIEWLADEARGESRMTVDQAVDYVEQLRGDLSLDKFLKQKSTGLALITQGYNPVQEGAEDQQEDQDNNNNDENNNSNNNI